VRPELPAELAYRDPAELAELLVEMRRQRDLALNQRDELEDELRRFRQRYTYGVTQVLEQLSQRPELVHTKHAAA
jgi:hypothetical protein